MDVEQALRSAQDRITVLELTLHALFHLLTEEQKAKIDTALAAFESFTDKVSALPDNMPASGRASLDGMASAAHAMRERLKQPPPGFPSAPSP